MMGNKVTNIKMIDSKSELKKRIDDECFEKVLLGEDSEIEKEFYLLEVFWKTTIKNGIKIGIISEGHGLKPNYLFNDKGMLYIGFNKEIDIVDCNNLIVLKKIILDSLYFEMYFLECQSKIIVVHELGVMCISKIGEIYWRFSTDVIVNYKVSEDAIKIVTDEQKLLMLDKAGNIIREETL